MLKETDKLLGLEGLTESSGWYLPHANLCWISERHDVCKIDASGVIHCENGPAIHYPDGWSIWAWHGVRVPQAVIEQADKISVPGILSERNSEVRRVMIERYGIERLMCAQEVQSVHVDGDYQLVSFPDPAEGSIKALKMKCPGTGAVYVHTVPPHVETVPQALAWKRGRPETEDYKSNLIWER